MANIPILGKLVSATEDHILAGADEIEYGEGMLDDVIGAMDDQTLLVSPSSIVRGWLCHASTGESSWSGDLHQHRRFTVTGGSTYYVTARTPSSSAASYPAILWLDDNGDVVGTAGTAAGTTYEELEVTAPSAAVEAAVNSANTDLAVPTLRTDGDLAQRLAEINDRLDASEHTTEQVGYRFSQTNMDAVIREAKKDPFCFDEFDKGYVTFCFDDLRADDDSIASIFEEFGFPLCLAAIPLQLNGTASGLTEARGSYTVGMTLKQVCDQVVALGGEILAHNNRVITAANQYDYDIMYDYFFRTKQRLEEAGYEVRGLVRAGGSGYILQSAETERWAMAAYEYSNMGYTVDHTLERININNPLASVKTAIDNAAANKTWIRFFGHDYSYGGGETLTDEDDLREILQYCQDAGVEVVTYAYMMDRFGSSQIRQGVGTLMWMTAIPTEVKSERIWNADSNTAYANTNERYACAFYDVSPGDVYAVTGRSGYSSAAYPVVMFFSDSSNYRLAEYGTDQYQLCLELEVTAPANASVMVVNSSDITKAYPSAKKQSTLSTAELQDEIEALIDRTDANADDIGELQDDVEQMQSDISDIAHANDYAFVTATPDSHVDDMLISALNKATYALEGASYSVYSVSPGDVYRITGRSGANASAYPAAAFFQSGSNYRLSAEGTEASTVYEDLQVTAPANAATMIVQSSRSTVIPSAKKRIAVDITAIMESVPASATVGSTGLITFSNSGGTQLFTVQLPLYDGGVT